MARKHVAVLVLVLLTIGAAACAGFGTGDPVVDGVIAQRTLEAAAAAQRATERAAVEATAQAEVERARRQAELQEEITLAEVRMQEQMLAFDQETARLALERQNAAATQIARATATAFYPTEQAILRQVEKERREADLDAFLMPVRRVLWIAVPVGAFVLLAFLVVRAFDKLLPILARRLSVRHNLSGSVDVFTSDDSVSIVEPGLAVAPGMRVTPEGVQSTGYAPTPEMHMTLTREAYRVKAAAAGPRVVAAAYPAAPPPAAGPLLPAKIEVVAAGESDTVEGWYREVERKLLSPGEEGGTSE